MKRALCMMLLAVMLLGTLCLGAGAKASAPALALDKEQIMLEYNGKTPTKEEMEMLNLANHYRIQYTLDQETGELNIFCGTDEEGNKIEQAMLPYVRNTWVPWQEEEQLSSIKTAYIHEGVQSVGRYSFYQCDTLETVYIPHSVRKINVTTFYQCKNLETVYYAGTEQDFLIRVIYEKTRNWYGVDQDGNETVDEYEAIFTMMDKMHFGESVLVRCVNEEGDIVAAYTVGGYFAGDEYSITPRELEGLTYVGKKTEITGTFKKNDQTIYELVYHCDHEYAVADPAKPCGSFCTKCGHADPNPPVEHVWGEKEVEIERSFLSKGYEVISCEVCEAKIEKSKQPIALFVAIPVGCLLLIGGAALAIIIPIRKKRKLKELTW